MLRLNEQLWGDWGKQQQRSVFFGGKLEDRSEK